MRMILKISSESNNSAMHNAQRRRRKERQFQSNRNGGRQHWMETARGYGPSGGNAEIGNRPFELATNGGVLARVQHIVHAPLSHWQV